MDFGRKVPLQPMLAIDIFKWPGLNQAFMFSFVLTTLLALIVVPIGRRRKADRKATWGEAMVGGVFIFAVMFLAFGVVPHQFLDHADKDLGWHKDKVLYGPFDIIKPQALGGPFPFTVSFEAIRDIIVVVIHVYYIGMMMILFTWWQKRGAAKPREVEVSTYGRPLVKRS